MISTRLPLSKYTPTIYLTPQIGKGGDIVTLPFMGEGVEEENTYKG